MRGIFIIMVSLLVSSPAGAQSWSGALRGIGEATSDIADIMLQNSLQEKRERRLMEQRYQQERQLMKQQVERQNAFLQQQQSVREIIETQRRMIAERDQKITALMEERQKISLLIEELKLYRQRPTWAQTVRTEQFRTWIKKQPQYIRALGASNIAKDAILLLDIYAETQNQEQNISAAAAPDAATTEEEQ